MPSRQIFLGQISRKMDFSRLLDFYTRNVLKDTGEQKIYQLINKTVSHFSPLTFRDVALRNFWGVTRDAEKIVGQGGPTGAKGHLLP